MASSAASQELVFKPASSTLSGLADGLQEDYQIIVDDAKTPEDVRQAAKTLIEAEECFFNEDAAGALSKAQDALEVYRKMSNADGVATAARLLVLLAGYRGQVEETIMFAEKERDQAKAAGSSKGEAKMMLALAEASLGLEDHDAKEVMKMATAAKEIFRSTGDVLMEGRAALAILDMHIRQGGEQKEKGQSMWKTSMEAQELFTQIGNRRGIALSFHGLSGSHAFRGSFDNATRAAKEALNLFKTMELKRLEALELETLASFHMCQAEPEQALPFAERALKAARAAGSATNSAWEVEATANVIEAHLARGAPASAKKTAEQALERFQAAGSQQGEASVLHMFARVFSSRDDHTRALTFADEAATVFGKIGNKKGAAGSLRLAAQIQISRGENDQAIASAQKAVKLAKQLPDSEDHALALRTLMQACLAQGDIEEATRTASEESALHRDAGSKQKEALSMLSTCSIHSATGDFDKAVATAADAQQLIHKIGDAKVEAKAWQTIAEAQMAAEKHSAALWALDRAKKLYAEVGDKKQAVTSRLLIAQANFQQAVQNDQKGGAEADTQKMVETALSEASDALELARAQGDMQQVAAALMVLAKAQTAGMLFPEALKSAGEAAEVSRKSGDDWGEGSAHSLCAHVHMLCERPGRAGRAASQAMLLFQKCRDFQAEAWAAGVFDRIAEQRRSSPPAVFLAGTTMKKSAGIPKVGLGLGLPAQMLFEDEELEFDAPLMQAGPCAGLRPKLSAALAKKLMEQRAAAPPLFSK
uniref:MalT-like TPR region domain-containing protein n=1 Tax=Alexandrium catenella TaxID=2925 RepID=A0A7S1KZI4_ALECA|mmetsp:Transcript_103233/g.274518  ORF Transcript_103233/g.274518 Transcript_103233/m.274518 type:complete len:765 (+) Transcript_103233:90-2384(+)